MTILGTIFTGFPKAGGVTVIIFSETGEVWPSDEVTVRLILCFPTGRSSRVKTSEAALFASVRETAPVSEVH